MCTKHKIVYDSWVLAKSREKNPRLERERKRERERREELSRLGNYYLSSFFSSKVI